MESLIWSSYPGILIKWMCEDTSFGIYSTHLSPPIFVYGRIRLKLITIVSKTHQTTRLLFEKKDDFSSLQHQSLQILKVDVFS